MSGYDATKGRIPKERTPPDRGCEVSPKCIDCPLPTCKYDNPADYKTEKRKARHALIAQAVETEKLTKIEAAERFQCTPRSVFRIMQRSREDA